MVPQLALFLCQFFRRGDARKLLLEIFALLVHLCDQRLEFFLALLAGVGVDIAGMLCPIRPHGRITPLKQVVIDLRDASGSRLSLLPHIRLEVHNAFLFRLRFFPQRRLAYASVDTGGGCALHIAGDVGIDVQRSRCGHMLIGLVTVKDLLLCEDDDATIESIMQEHVITVGTLDDKEQVAQMFSKYNFLALPVVDTENRLVGIVTFDDAMDVMEDEATEDMEKMAAMLPSEHPYMRSTPIEIWKNRIPWLLLLMVSATLTGIVITKFENSLAALPCLTAFIPMLMDTGGNSGSQACVSIIRGISLNEIEFRDLGRVVWKEIRVSVLCGVCLAVACFAKIIVIDMLLLKSESVTYLVAFVVCATMAVTVCLAKIVGSTLPLLAKKLGFDPAVMASPIITTIVDFLSLLVYFAFATAMLGIG